MINRRDWCRAALLASALPAATRAQEAKPGQDQEAKPGQNQEAKPTQSIDDFFRDFTTEWIRHNPELATRTRFFKGEEQDAFERQLNPLSRERQLAVIDRARTGLAALAKFDRARLTPSQRVSADMMEWQLGIVVQEEKFLDYTFPLEQMRGANVQLIESLTVGHPLATERDAENYVAALGQVGQRMDEAIADARRLAEKKTIPPKFILIATVKQLQSFADSSPGQNPFVTVLTQKTAAIKTLPDARRKALLADAEKIVSGDVYPAWRRAIALLESQTPAATDDAGLWRLKGGPEAYAYFLRRFTTTDLTPDQVHEIGLQQVARIEGTMDTLLKKLGRNQGTVKARIAKLKADMAYPNPASEESRVKIMQDIDVILRDAEKRAALLFDVRPKSPVVAQAFPAFRENNAAANYNGPSPDGSRPGVFQYPRRLSNMTKFGLRSLVYHETVPGHHFQIALEVENKTLPTFRQIRALGGISAYSEGWGLYAERLAAESGWYGDDIEGQLGQLDAELFRARRLVVDTGLHAKRWTRQQGIDFGIEPSEVERYAVYPGQACSYMIGELRIIEFREKAKKALGDKFSLRDFHTEVLSLGTLPLNLLEKQIDAFIRAKGGSA